MSDLGAFRFEYVCEAIAPDGSRSRIGSFPVPSVCLMCGCSPITDDFATGTATLDGAMLVTVNNRCGLLCAACTARERSR